MAELRAEQLLVFDNRAYSPGEWSQLLGWGIQLIIVLFTNLLRQRLRPVGATLYPLRVERCPPERLPPVTRLNFATAHRDHRDSSSPPPLLFRIRTIGYQSTAAAVWPSKDGRHFLRLVAFERPGPDVVVRTLSWTAHAVRENGRRLIVYPTRTAIALPDDVEPHFRPNATPRELEDAIVEIIKDEPGIRRFVDSEDLFQIIVAIERAGIEESVRRGVHAAPTERELRVLRTLDVPLDDPAERVVCRRCGSRAESVSVDPNRGRCDDCADRDPPAGPKAVKTSAVALVFVGVLALALSVPVLNKANTGAFLLCLLLAAIALAAATYTALKGKREPDGRRCSLADPAVTRAEAAELEATTYVPGKATADPNDSAEDEEEDREEDGEEVPDGDDRHAPTT